MIRTFQGIAPRIAATAFVDQSAQVIGDVEIGEHSSIWMNAVLRGDVHYKVLEIHLGATLDGKLEHSGALGADGQRGNLKLAANNA